MTMKKVFIVDDDNMYQLILKHLIMKVNKNVIVETFDNGAPAIVALSALAVSGGALPDIILLDINMPGMDGWQFLSAVRAVSNNIAEKLNIYVISSSLDMRDKERAHACEIVRDYICKPVSNLQLREMLS
jgi:CheY-like chemotaxis protein